MLQHQRDIRYWRKPMEFCSGIPISSVSRFNSHLTAEQYTGKSTFSCTYIMKFKNLNFELFIKANSWIFRCINWFGIHYRRMGIMGQPFKAEPQPQRTSWCPDIFAQFTFTYGRSLETSNKKRIKIIDRLVVENLTYSRLTNLVMRITFRGSKHMIYGRKCLNVAKLPTLKVHREPSTLVEFLSVKIGPQ